MVQKLGHSCLGIAYSLPRGRENGVNRRAWHKPFKVHAILIWKYQQSRGFLLDLIMKKCLNALPKHLHFKGIQRWCLKMGYRYIEVPIVQGKGIITTFGRIIVTSERYYLSACMAVSELSSSVQLPSLAAS